MNIENDKFVYIKPPFNSKLIDVIYSKLAEIGFPKKMIVNQDARKFAQKGDYIALILEYPQNMEFIVGKIKKDRKFVGSKPLIDLPTELVEYDELIRMKIDT